MYIVTYYVECRLVLYRPDSTRYNILYSLSAEDKETWFASLPSRCWDHQMIERHNILYLADMYLRVIHAHEASAKHSRVSEDPSYFKHTSAIL